MFISFVIGVLASMLLFYHRAGLPEMSLMAVMAGVTIALLVFKRYWWPYKTGHFYVGLIIGFQWAFWHSFFQPQLPEPIQAEVSQPQASKLLWQVTGEVVNLPRITPLESSTSQQELKHQKVQVTLKLHRLQVVNCTQLSQNHKSNFLLNSVQKSQNSQSCQWQFSLGQRPVIRLADYQAKKIPHAGETWQFVVRLKPIHGLMNPGGYDFESTMWQQGVVARGWVVHPKNESTKNSWIAAQKLAEASHFSISAWRENLRQYWTSQFANSPNLGVYLALLLGDRSGLSPEQWQRFQQTGTIHLMAISGLHIGIAAGIGAFLAGLLWQWGIRLFPRKPWLWLHGTPKVQWMAVGALGFATGYALLAGFSIPTQRAWLMVVAMLLFVWIRRPFQPWSALALAALLVLLWQPASVLSPGFWLSFMAVALIFVVLFHPKIKPLKNWQKLLVIQFVLTVGLLPLLAYYFHQFPLVSFFANLVAVPAVSLVGLPLLLLTALLPFSLLHKVNEWFWQALMQFLQMLTQWQPPLNLVALSGWQVVMIYGLLFYGLLTKANLKQGVKLGLGILLIWFLPKLWQPMLENGSFKATLLDVGQGQSLVVETAQHVAVLDTGPKWNTQYNGASLAILPYFRSQGVSKVDKLVVSHSDIDHSGGTQQLVEALAVDKITSGQPQTVAQQAHLPQSRVQPCLAGQQWQWDGVRFQVLAPAKDWPFKSDNDRSCVLRIVNGKFAFLVMGDASVKVEKWLLKNLPSRLLQADILVAGHHGSRTASALDFLKVVKPKWVLFSSGFQNRFHFPSQAVVQRLAALGIPWRNTAEAGAITVWVSTEGIQLESYRQQNVRWYHFKTIE